MTSDMGERFRITRAAELETLPVFRDFIQDACRRTGIDNETCFDLKLAVDEACTNVIAHGYAGLNPGSIILELDIAPREVTVKITDFGRPFEPAEAPMPDVSAALEDRPIGGLGLYFIYSTMDEVDYRATEEGNCLILTKRLMAVEG